MTDTVPPWHEPTGGPDTGTAGWSPPQGQARPQAPAPGAAGQSTRIEQVEERLFDELGRAQAALAQVQAEAQAARVDAQAARAQARDAHEAAEVLLDQVAAWGDAGSGTAPEGPVRASAGRAPAAPVPDGSRAGGDDLLAEALAELAADLQAAADARARGEIDARQALRLARAGFHKAHRVIAREGREELRAVRERARRPDSA